MTLEEFKQLIEKERSLLESLPKALQALCYDNQGDWHKAHEIVQNASDADSAWVHAYLHRKEGDLSNARYWYNRTSKSEFQGSLEQEWEQIARELLIKVNQEWMFKN
jgi:DNA polymerase III delta prime subunit